MHRMGPGTLEIGYWVHVAHTGRGVATAAARLLTAAAGRIDGVATVWIVCDEANVRSAAVPRRLGYRLDRVDSMDVTPAAGTGRAQRWVWAVDRATG
jgi:RimJ/RimL family protein N-acetyltransferase